MSPSPDVLRLMMLDTAAATGLEGSRTVCSSTTKLNSEILTVVPFILWLTTLSLEKVAESSSWSHQEHKMSPNPDFGYDTYKGYSRLAGKVAFLLVTVLQSSCCRMSACCLGFCCLL